MGVRDIIYPDYPVFIVTPRCARTLPTSRLGGGPKTPSQTQSGQSMTFTRDPIRKVGVWGREEREEKGRGDVL